MPIPSLIIWYLGAVVCGAVIAYVTVSLFRWVAPSGSTRQYWSDVGKDIHGLLYGDEGKFWGHYVNVIRQTCIYVGRQLLALAVAFGPLILAFYLAGPALYAQWGRGMDLVAIPQNVGTLSSDESQHTFTLPDGVTLELPETANPLALCEPGRFGCFVLRGFGFTIIDVDPAMAQNMDLVVIRSGGNAWNPLWPYLSDPEFLFFVSLVLGSIVFFIREKKTIEVGSQEYSINMIDYVLTLIATRNMSFMQKLGDRETRRNSKLLNPIKITKPVYISGLARSGTTILLEKLATGQSVATHRYRDFPFIMTPIRWNKFLRFFGTRQMPSERPHQDKIKITRDSPDAFEEPIWQHYFPYLHSKNRNHILDSKTQNDKFSQFYHQHLQKILMLREGTRYLSKGNYNLTRIEYIARLYPDAIFIVPIRHPISHVESLIRQHKLFTHYSENDPKIPTYLRAVGHYEFGPQRTPIHVTDAGASEIELAWKNNDDLLGYAIQWREVYEYVSQLMERDKILAKRIHLVRFEDLCSDPQIAFSQIIEFADFGEELSAASLAQGIEASTKKSGFSEDQKERCWNTVYRIAKQYGYSKSVGDILPFSGAPESKPN